MVWRYDKARGWVDEPLPIHDELRNETDDTTSMPRVPPEEIPPESAPPEDPRVTAYHEMVELWGALQQATNRLLDLMEPVPPARPTVASEQAQFWFEGSPTAANIYAGNLGMHVTGEPAAPGQVTVSEEETRTAPGSLTAQAREELLDQIRRAGVPGRHWNRADPAADANWPRISDPADPDDLPDAFPEGWGAEPTERDQAALDAAGTVR